jgi:2-oxoglutarate dehydrogenase complex dehydrogenase (E1) component-like enzyme
VAVVDPKTKKVANRVFTITDKTKITRAGKAVAVADVTAQKDEKVAVVVDHDKLGDEAIHVRFPGQEVGRTRLLHRRNRQHEHERERPRTRLVHESASVDDVTGLG